LWRHVASERFLWIAGGTGSQGDAEIQDVIRQANLEVGETLCLETLESTSRLQLRLPFFSAKQLGRAAEYGPLGVDVVLDFCQELNRALKKTSADANVGLYCSTRDGAVLSALLLMGSFLILERNMCAGDALGLIMPADRPDAMEWKFPRPWCSKEAWSKDALSLKECLRGLEVAAAKNWLHRKSLSGSSRRNIASAYDAMPIFTFKLVRDSMDGAPYDDNITFWVAADPVTTVVDPSRRPSNTGASANSSPKSVENNSSSRKGRKSLIQKIASQSSFFSTQTNSRSSLFRALRKSTDPTKDTSLTASADRPVHLEDFAKWLKNDLGCVMLVRANFEDEPNLPGGSYGDFFHERGIRQVDLQFTDGTAPPQEVAQSLLVEVGLLLDSLKEKTIQKPCNYAVVVHCKSGLGRSMSLLCMLAVALFPDIQAADTFGWARIARPGAIQTAVQERFVRSLDEEAATTCCLLSENKSGPSVRNLFNSEKYQSKQSQSAWLQDKSL